MHAWIAEYMGCKWVCICMAVQSHPCMQWMDGCMDVFVHAKQCMHTSMHICIHITHLCIDGCVCEHTYWFGFVQEWKKQISKITVNFFLVFHYVK